VSAFRLTGDVGYRMFEEEDDGGRRGLCEACEDMGGFRCVYCALYYCAAHAGPYDHADVVAECARFAAEDDGDDDMIDAIKDREDRQLAGVTPIISAEESMSSDAYEEACDRAIDEVRDDGHGPTRVR
jgi:hypothetical protein